MNLDLARELDQRLRLIEENMIRYRQGVVTDTSPLSVALGGSTVEVTDVKAIAGLALAVDDVVSILTFGNDLIVLGLVDDGKGIGNEWLTGTASTFNFTSLGGAFQYGGDCVTVPETGRYEVSLIGDVTQTNTAGFTAVTAGVEDHNGGIWGTGAIPLVQNQFHHLSGMHHEADLTAGRLLRPFVTAPGFSLDGSLANISLGIRRLRS